MTSSSVYVGAEFLASSLASAAARKHEWIERCYASIFDKDPMLAAEDILDLADTLWDRPSCQSGLPELAASLLFSGQLSSSG